jgi:hypothetical protein
MEQLQQTFYSGSYTQGFKGCSCVGLHCIPFEKSALGSHAIVVLISGLFLGQGSLDATETN